MRLLSECVTGLGAAGGAAELAVADGPVSIRTVGDWTGDARVTTTISAGDGMTARIRLGPRSNGEAYSKRQIAQLRDAADAVAEVLAEESPRS